jgi:hypothetical protein
MLGVNKGISDIRVGNRNIRGISGSRDIWGIRKIGNIRGIMGIRVY